MSAMNRLQRVSGHLATGSQNQHTSPSTVAASTNPADDVVVVSAVRTAIGKAKRGKFSQAHFEDLLAPVLKACVERVGLKPDLVDDIAVGCVIETGMRAGQARMAAYLAGFPDRVSVHTINRQCSSGLQAIAHIAASINAGYYDIGIGSGCEIMSEGRLGPGERGINPVVLEHDQARQCLTPMGITSENVAERYGITREVQDALAAQSQQRAEAAIKAGRFRDEIVPVAVTLTDPKTGAEHKVVMDTDEGVRAGTTAQKLGRLKPAFKADGSTTAGNSSQVSDGASAVLLMKRSKAQQLGLPIMGVFRSFAVTGVDPAVMGIGPLYAIPKAVANAGLSMDQIDLFEINEAFASQAAYCVQELKLPWDKVNVNGGAIAIGHPLGMTGARMTATLLHEMKRRPGSRYGVVSMCIGTGMGAAAVYEIQH